MKNYKRKPFYDFAGKDSFSKGANVRGGTAWPEKEGLRANGEMQKRRPFDRRGGS